MEDTDWSSESDDDVTPQHQVFLGHLKILLLFITMWQFVFKISNAAMTSLLHFLRYFIVYAGRAFHCDTMQEMGQSVPLTLGTVQQLISLQRNDSMNYVVCPSCDSVYDYQDCVQIGKDGRQESKECLHVDFRNHPQASHRKPCGTTLLKRVRTKCGYVLSPIKVYPYKPLNKSI